MKKDIKFVSKPSYIDGIRVVNDIEEAVECLKKGETIARFEWGESMMPLLNNGEYCTIEPVDDINDIEIGDAVLCEVNGVLMTHMVIIKSNANCNSPYFLIGSSYLHFYGWTNKIYGLCKGTNILEKPSFLEYAEEVS